MRTSVRKLYGRNTSKENLLTNSKTYDIINLKKGKENPKTRKEKNYERN